MLASSAQPQRLYQPAQPAVPCRPVTASSDGRLRVVGQRLPRIEGVEKVTGAAVYAADVRLPGLVWGKVLRSPYPHARIRSIDAAAARALPGVAPVFTRWG